MADKIYLNSRFGYREDTLANWQEADPILERGEIAFVRDGSDGKFVKIGDGSTPWALLPYAPLPKGEKGAQGEPGPKGDKGDRGNTGATGPQGPMGPKGDKGAKGEQGIQGEKGEKGDPGTDGKDAVIDQTYSPESENAQSGKAVAEAINDKADKEEWELINELTLTEDAVAIISTDLNGNPFALKKFQLDFQTAIIESGSGTVTYWLHTRKKGDNYAYSPFSHIQNSLSQSKKGYAHFIGILMGHWYSLCESSDASIEGFNYATTFPHGVRSESKHDLPLTVFKLTGEYSGTVPSGTTIKLWGVRA